MERERSILVGFVGLGRIASLLEDDPLREKPATHAGAAAVNSRCRIVGGVDTAEERRELFSRRWSVPTYSTVAEFMNVERPDILVIATHPPTHYQYVRTAAEYGTPVVICEKPVAPTYHIGRKMAALEDTGKVKVVVNHERRFSRDYLRSRAAVLNGELGKLIGVTGRLYFGSSARHDHVFLHDGTHMVDAIHFLTDDEITLRRKVGRYRSTRSSVFLHGTTRRDGVPVAIEIGAQRNYLHFEIVLSFSDGEIRVGNGIFSWSRSRPSLHYSAYRSLMNAEYRPPRPSDYFSGMMAEAVRLADDPSAASRSTLKDGLAAMSVIRKAGLLP